ncbi:MAG: TetR/AcrR family transcriptional regulator [Candidatus Desulfacyla sp.]
MKSKSIFGPKKSRLLSKARPLFWQKGYHGTSMKDIAQASGCKSPNLYNFFSSKEEILFEVLREEMEQILSPIRHLEEDESTHPTDQLRMLIQSHLKITLSYRRSAKLLFDVEIEHLSREKREEIKSMRDSYDRIIRRIIRRGRERGCFSNVDEKLAGFMIASMITRTRIWFHPKKGVSVDALGEFIYQFVLEGLGKRGC